MPRALPGPAARWSRGVSTRDPARRLATSARGRGRAVPDAEASRTVDADAIRAAYACLPEWSRPRRRSKIRSIGGPRRGERGSRTSAQLDMRGALMTLLLLALGILAGIQWLALWVIDAADGSSISRAVAARARRWQHRLVWALAVLALTSLAHCSGSSVRAPANALLALD